MPPRPLVYVVILNWNGLRDTLSCIEQVKRSNYGNLRILVIDNGSADDSAAQLSTVPEIEFRALPKNAGYTGGNNIAIRHALEQGADFVWVLNNDTDQQPGTLAALMAAARADEQIGLVSPVIYHREDADAVQHCCTRFNLRTLEFSETCDLEQTRAWQDETPGQIALWGTALLIKRELLERVGAFDERLFAYREDLDLSLRSAAAGFKNVVALDAKIHHSWPNGLRRPYYYYFMVRNELLVWPKHLSLKQRLRKLYWNLSRTRTLLASLKGRDELVDAALAGLWHGWLGRGGAYDQERRMPALVRRFAVPRNGLKNN